jgi:hypothetical protein
VGVLLVLVVVVRVRGVRAHVLDAAVSILQQGRSQ